MKSADLLDRLTEPEFQGMIVRRARARGWLVHHDRGDVRQTIGGDPGFPDLVLAKGGRIIFAELKARRGRLTGAQAYWIRELTGDLYPGIATFVWRPGDWPFIQGVIDEP